MEFEISNNFRHRNCKKNRNRKHEISTKFRSAHCGRAIIGIF